MNDTEFFRRLTGELNGIGDELPTEAAAEGYDDGPEDSDVLVDVHGKFPVTLRHEVQLGRLLCYARLGEISQPASFSRLLAANTRLVPQRMWFAFEGGTGQVLVSFALYRGAMTIEAAARRVRTFASALSPWSEAIAALEEGDEPPPSPGETLPEGSPDGGAPMLPGNLDVLSIRP